MGVPTTLVYRQLRRSQSTHEVRVHEGLHALYRHKLFTFSIKLSALAQRSLQHSLIVVLCFVISCVGGPVSVSEVHDIYREVNKFTLVSGVSIHGWCELCVNSDMPSISKWCLFQPSISIELL